MILSLLPLKVIERKSKRVIVTSFASNVARMETVFYCAEKTGRQISLVGRSMHRIYKAAVQCGYLSNLKKPIDSRDAKKIDRKKIFPDAAHRGRKLNAAQGGRPGGRMAFVMGPAMIPHAGDTG